MIVADSNIPDLEQAMRDLINAPRRHAELCAIPTKFSQLCSALDVLGDTELAMGSYLDEKVDRSEKPVLYLRTYGMLQALILQQDAVAHIADSLGLEYPEDERLRDIREIRNNAAGHPTRRGRAPGRAFNHVVRWSLSAHTFELMTFDAEGTMSNQKVDAVELIQTQRAVLAERLSTLVDAERERENQHRRKFVGDPLASALDGELSYWVGKVFEQIEGTAPTGLGEAALGFVERAIGQFVSKLDERGELEAIPEAIQYELGPARHALERIREYLDEGPQPRLEMADALMFASHLESKVEALRSLAKEIDRTYTEDA